MKKQVVYTGRIAVGLTGSGLTLLVWATRNASEDMRALIAALVVFVMLGCIATIAVLGVIVYRFNRFGKR